MTTELNDKEKAVMALLAGCEDVSIEAMFKAVYSDEVLSNRAMQHRLGGFLTRLNRKLETAKPTPLRVKPGHMKRTYRLTEAV